jgi:hypothetical protein
VKSLAYTFDIRHPSKTPHHHRTKRIRISTAKVEVASSAG